MRRIKKTKCFAAAAAIVLCVSFCTVSLHTHGGTHHEDCPICVYLLSTPFGDVVASCSVQYVTFHFISQYYAIHHTSIRFHFLPNAHPHAPPVLS